MLSTRFSLFLYMVLSGILAYVIFDSDALMYAGLTICHLSIMGIMSVLFAHIAYKHRMTIESFTKKHPRSVALMNPRRTYYKRMLQVFVVGVMSGTIVALVYLVLAYTHLISTTLLGAILLTFITVSLLLCGTYSNLYNGLRHDG